VELKGCDEVALVQFAKHCRKLTSLDVTCCKMTDEAIMTVAEGCKQLTSLNLHLTWRVQLVSHDAAEIIGSCPLAVSCWVSALG
jgi:hypothetical protein